MRNCMALALIVGLGASVAHADFFSFASDLNPDGPTLSGPPGMPPGLGGVFDAAALNPDNAVTVNLLWDADEDGPGAATSISALFVMQMNFTSYTAFPIGGNFLHSYTGGGFFDFVNPASGASILRVQFENALFSSWSPTPLAWGPTATIQTSYATDPTLTFIPGPTGPLAGRDLSTSEEFAFTLTALRALGGGAVPVAQGGMVMAPWASESSWSARAIPAPGTLMLALAGLGVLARRRRA